MTHTTELVVRESHVDLPISHISLEGDLTVPEGARGMVLFAHGSGSGRKSPRNRHVARALQDAGLATLLFDLLTPQEEIEDARTAALRFDVQLLADRLTTVTDLIVRDPAHPKFKIGYFGASTGAAAALIAAASKPWEVQAVVSRGGRPDLAGKSLHAVTAPTLLIVGGDDFEVIDLNRKALAQLTCTKDLEIVPGATHLFPEAGALEEVSRLAAAWFGKYLR